MSRYTPDLTSTSKENTYYALTMFPYPSGIGLHCGHASTFTITDVYARYQRMQGKTVFMPFGFDAFGLPTENYAIQQGKPAREVTDSNKENFLTQVKALDISFDYDRVIDTSTPEYYKWTQRLFLQLHSAGLVYRDTLRVNRCPSCQTVLANDQVVDGKCERCKSEIQQKQKPQRFIKITDYADRLIDDLDLVDRPEETKIAQKNRIGRSTGCEIDFNVIDTTITVFTTRPDTIYGVTAIVLAPENTDIDHLLDQKHTKAIQDYRNEALAKTAVQRQQEIKDKTGVFSGVYATHPLTDQAVPVWFADYVLPDYGTGAVMMVPAHDERDSAFATKFEIPKKQVILPTENQEQGENESSLKKNTILSEAYTGPGTLIKSDQFNGLSNTEAKQAITTHLKSINKGRAKTSYRLRDRSVSRQRYRGSPIPMYYKEYNAEQGPLIVGQGDVSPQKGKKMITRESVAAIIYHQSKKQYVFIHLKELDQTRTVHGGVDQGETIEEAITKEILEETGFTNIKKIERLNHIARRQRCVPHKDHNKNSYGHIVYVEIDGEPGNQDPTDAERLTVTYINKHEVEKNIAKDELMQYFWQQYTQREKTKNNTEQITKIPLPISESELPIILPLDLETYKPKGKSPLEDHPTFPHYHQNDKIYTRECDTLDTFMCSSFYFLRFPDAHNPDELISKELADRLFPIPLYTGGKEHTVGHLLYSRFIHKFLYDQGYVSSPEPFSKLIHQGMVLGADGRKMGKRYGNGIDPIEVVDKYGPDAVRTYMMFMGPVEQDKARNDGALNGVKKFLDRIKKIPNQQRYTTHSDEVESKLHETILGVTHDIENMKLNTAVSKYMVLTNTIYEHQACTSEQLKTFVLLLAPYATQLADQLRADLGETDDIHFHARPIADESKIQSQQINLPIQINGKVRGKIDIAPGLTQEEVYTLAQQVDNIAKHIGDLTPKKIIRIQDRILNIIL